MNKEIYFVHLDMKSLWYACDGSGLIHDPLHADKFYDYDEAVSRCPENYEVRRITLTYVEDVV